jgi:hypothetical protein
VSTAYFAASYSYFPHTPLCLLRISTGKRLCGSFSQILRGSRQSLAAFVFALHKSLAGSNNRLNIAHTHLDLNLIFLSEREAIRYLAAPSIGTPLEQPLHQPRRIILAEPPPHCRFQLLPYANMTVTATGYITSRAQISLRTSTTHP